MGHFSGRVDFCFHRVEAELLDDGCGSTAVVAGEHDDFQSECVEFLDRCAGGGFDPVGDGENSRRLAIDDDEHRGLAPHTSSFTTEASSGSRPVIFSLRRKSGLPTSTNYIM